MTIESSTARALAVSSPADDALAVVPQIICGELRTGRILTTVPAADAAWSMVYNDAGVVNATTLLRSLSAKDAQELVSYLDPARCFLGARAGDHILEAGPIWRHDWDDDDGTLVTRASGLWSLFDHRKVMRVLAGGEDPATTQLSWSALSLGTIAKRLIETAMSHVGGSLPLVLPDDLAGVDDDDHRRTYHGYDLANLGEVLRQLTGVVGGPDIRFTPRLAADRQHVEWVMSVGTEVEPLLYQSGQDWRWDMTVPRGDLSGLSVTRDAAKLGYRAWVPGSGMAESMPLAMREDLTATDAGWPLLEVDDRNHSSTSNAATLGRHADALLDVSRRPWMTLAWQSATSAPPLGEYRPGDWTQVNVPTDHAYLAALGVTGLQRARILAVTGNLTQVVDIDTAPTMESR